MLDVNNAAAQYKAGPAQSEILDQMNSGVQDLDKIKKAAQQGRVPLDAIDAKVESLYSSMFAKYPDQKSYIAQYFSARGYDHYLGRELRLAEASRTQADTDQMAAQHMYFDTAVKAGVADPSGDYNDGVLKGMKIAQLSHEAQIMREKAELAKTLVDTDKAKHDLLKADAHQMAQDQTTAWIGLYGGTVRDQLSKLADQAIANNDNSSWDRLQKETLPFVLNRYDQMYSHYKQTGLASGAFHADDTDLMDKTYQDWRTAVTQQFTGDTSYYTAQKRSFDNYQQSLQLTAEKAIPSWTLMQKILGPAAPQVATILFSGDPGKMFNPDFLKTLSDELKGYNPLRPNRAVSLLTQAGEVLAGNTDINDIKPEQYDPAHLKTFSAAMGPSATSVMGPKADSGSKTSFLNANGAFSVITQRSIQPNA